MFSKGRSVRALITLVECVVDVALGAGSGNNLAGVSQDDGSGRNVEVDVGSGSNESFATDRNFADNNRVCSNPDSIFQSWSAEMLATAGCPNRDPLGDVDIRAQNCVRADHYSTEMADVQAGTDAGRR